MGTLIIVNKAVAGWAFLMLNFAISKGEITLVNALEGVKYVFLLLMVLMLSKLMPKILKEEISSFVLGQKMVAIFFIIIGIIIISKS